MATEPVAQLVEHPTFNRQVVGSIPTRLTRETVGASTVAPIVVSASPRKAYCGKGFPGWGRGLLIRRSWVRSPAGSLFPGPCGPGCDLPVCLPVVVAPQALCGVIHLPGGGGDLIRHPPSPRVSPPRCSPPPPHDTPLLAR